MAKLKRKTKKTEAPVREAKIGDNGGPLISLPYNWEPRIDQLPLWIYMETGGKRAVEIAHRRWGKDDIALHWTAVAANDTGYEGCLGRVGNYWHMLPKAAQARKAIWDAINPRTGKKRIDEAFPKQLRKRTNESEMKIEFKCGSMWQVVGSDNYDNLVGSPPIGIVFSEWALAKSQAWALLSPILEENGGWAMFITTPRGRNHAYKSLQLARKDPDWFGQVIPASKSNVFTSKQLDKIKADLIDQYGEEDGEALYDQEYVCSFDSQLLGAFYAKVLATAEREGRIRKFIAHDPDYPVQTAWDLGLSDDTSIWFYQVIGREVRILAFYENRGQLLSHYAKVLDTFAEAMGWQYWFTSPREAYHWVPWDARPKTLASKGKSLLEIAWEDHKLQFRVAKQLSVQDGIIAARKMISRSYFSEQLTSKGLECLRNYQREYDEDRRIYKITPLHNWASHGADAARIMATAYQVVPGRPSKVRAPAKDLPKKTFDELVAQTQNHQQEDYIG